MSLEIRVSNPSKWRTRVLIGVHVLILIHVVHWLVRTTTIAALEPSEAMAFSKEGVVNLGLILLLGAGALTAVFGRFFCGWGCHIIALQDSCRWLLIKVGITPKPLRSRVLRWVPFLAFVYMFLWPPVYRWVAGEPFPSVTRALTTTDLWAAMPSWGIALLTLGIVGFLIVYVLGAKGFCTYACPYGALFAGADRLAPLRIRVNDDCRQCARCTAACTSNVRVHEEVRDFGMVRDSQCMKCLDCVSVCPNDALFLGVGRPALGVRPRVEGPPAGRPWNVSWIEEGVLVAAFVLAFVTFRGLYGRVPFLMTLGLSGILAFLSLTIVRFVRRDQLRFGGWRLKRDGKATRAGVVFVAVMVGVGIFWAHSGFIRSMEIRGDRAFNALGEVREAAMALDWAGLGPDQRERVSRNARAFDTADRWGLIPDPSAFFKRAWLATLLGQSDRALAEVERAIEVQPLAPEVHRLHGRILVDQGRIRPAVMALSTAVELNPDAPESFLSLGSLLGSTGDIPRAREVFRRALLRHPDHPDLLYNFGVACAVDGDLHDARSAFERALDADPGHQKARDNLDELNRVLAGRE